MEMTIAEFKEKVKNVDNLVFKPGKTVNNTVLYYFWQAQGDNNDVKDYICEQLTEKLVLTDAYKVKSDNPNGQNKWIPEENIKQIAQHIIDATSYEAINPRSGFIDKTEITKKDKIHQQVVITFYTNEWSQTAREYVYKILKKDEDIDVVYLSTFLRISKKSIDEKVTCKHKCKTDRAIAQFDEIFEL